MMDNRDLEETMATLQRSLASEEEFSQTYQDMENFLADYPQRIVSWVQNFRKTKILILILIGMNVVILYCRI